MSEKNPLGELNEIFEILVTSYAQKGGVIPPEGDLCWKPATDAYETADSFVVQFDLAGLQPSQIEVLADEHNLLVRGIRPEAQEDGKKHFHKMEISVGPFARRVPIAVEVDPSSATATYRNGFLYVVFRKGAGEINNRRQIEIQNRK
jgi:HSP20 family protein